MNDDTGGALWFVANVLVAFLAVLIAYHQGFAGALATWLVLTVLLLLFRPR